MLRLRVCGSRLGLLCRSVGPLGAKQYATQSSLLPRSTGLRNPCLICGHSLSVVRCTTSQRSIRATSSRTTLLATSYPPIADGWSCHQPAAPTAMTTQTPAGRSVPCGAPATVDIWSGAAIAAQRFTRRSRGRIAESATKGLYRCGRTSTALDWAAVSPGFRQSVEGPYEATHLRRFR